MLKGWGEIIFEVVGLAVIAVLLAELGEWLIMGWRRIEVRYGSDRRVAGKEDFRRCPCAYCRRNGLEPCSDYDEPEPRR